jgi:hypothetical protein
MSQGLHPFGAANPDVDVPTSLCTDGKHLTWFPIRNWSGAEGSTSMPKYVSGGCVSIVPVQKKRNQLQHKKRKQTKREKNIKYIRKATLFFSLSLALFAAGHFHETLPTLSRSASSHPKSWKVSGVNSFITNVAERAVPNDKSPAW